MSVPAYALSATGPAYSISQFDSFDAMPKSATFAGTSSSTLTDAKSTAATQAPSDGKSFWDNLWDVINPLEHFPVVSTIYDSITHNKVGDLEKVAGDTLYGGLMGFASSVADIAFEKITGRDFSDTVMGWLHHDDAAQTILADSQASSVSPASTASAAKIAETNPQASAPQILATSDVPKDIPVAPAPLASANMPADNNALVTALQRNGMNADMQARALDAYRRTMSMQTSPALTASTLH